MDNNIYDVVYKESGDNNEKRNKKKRKRGVAGKAIALALSCSLLGGLTGATMTYLGLKNDTQSNFQSSIDLTKVNFKENEGNLTASEIYAKVAPAVVTISAKGIESFNGWFTQETEGIGSGFIIKEDGSILTNYHVIQGAKEVTVTLSDGTEAKANVINYDQEQDIALIKIIDDIKMPAIAELGDSEKLIPGEDVVAIGTPLSADLSQTITSGIVSAINRNVTTDDGITLNLIQTNTAINPGNSGGPLVNKNGEVIGINTLKMAGEAEGIGFAIPINDIKGDIDTLSKPILYLGISLQTIDEKLGEQFNLEPGLYVSEVNEFSPAELAGLKSGDLIIGADGKEISTFEELIEIRDSKEAGEILNIEIKRGEETKKVDIILTTKN